MSALHGRLREIHRSSSEVGGRSPVCVDVSVTAGTAETASFFITMRHLRGVVEAHDGIQFTGIGKGVGASVQLANGRVAYRVLRRRFGSRGRGRR